MTPYGTPKGKDARIGNELNEPKKGLSKTELMAMMQKMAGSPDPGAPMTPSPLMPNVKRGKGK